MVAIMKEFILFVLLMLSTLGESKPLQRVRRTIIKDYFNPLTYPILKTQFEKGEDGKYHEAKDLTHSEVEYAVAHGISESDKIVGKSDKSSKETLEESVANTELSPKASDVPKFDLIGPFTTIWPLRESKISEDDKVLILGTTTILDSESEPQKLEGLEQQNAKLDIPIDSKWSLVPKLDDKPQAGGEKYLPGSKAGGKDDKHDKGDEEYLSDPKPNVGGKGYFPGIKLDEKDDKPFESGEVPVPKPDRNDDKAEEEGKKYLPGIKPDEGVKGYLPETKAEGKDQNPIGDKPYQDGEEYLPRPPIITEERGDDEKDVIGPIPKLRPAFNPPRLIPKRYSVRLFTMLPKPPVVEISEILPLPEIIEESSETAVVEHFTPSGFSKVKEGRRYFSKHPIDPLPVGYRRPFFNSAPSILKVSDDSEKLKGVTKSKIVDIGGHKVLVQNKVLTSPPLDPHRVHISMLSIQPIKEIIPDVLKDIDVHESNLGNKNRHQKDMKLYKAKERASEDDKIVSDFKEDGKKEKEELLPKPETKNGKTPSKIIEPKIVAKFDSVFEESERVTEALPKLLPKPEAINVKIMPEVTKVKAVDEFGSKVTEKSKKGIEVLPNLLHKPEIIDVKRKPGIIEEKVDDKVDSAFKVEVEKGTEELSNISPKLETVNNNRRPEVTEETSVDEFDSIVNEKVTEALPKLLLDPKNTERVHDTIEEKGVVEVDSSIKVVGEKETDLPSKMLPNPYTINAKRIGEGVEEKVVYRFPPSKVPTSTVLPVVDEEREEEITDSVLKDFRLEAKIKDEENAKENLTGLKTEKQSGSKLKGDMDEKGAKILRIIPTIESTPMTITQIDSLISTDDLQFKRQMKTQNPTSYDILTAKKGMDAMSDKIGFDKEGQRKDEEVAESQNVEVKVKAGKEPVYNLQEGTTEWKKGESGTLSSTVDMPLYSPSKFTANRRTGMLNTAEVKTSNDMITEEKKREGERLYTTENEALKDRAGFKINEEIINEKKREPEILKTTEVAPSHSGTEFVADKDINKDPKGEAGMFNTAEFAQSHNRAEFIANKDVVTKKIKGEVEMRKVPDFSILSSTNEFTPIKYILSEELEGEVEMLATPEAEFTASKALSKMKKGVPEMVDTAEEVTNVDEANVYEEESEMLNKPEVLSSRSRVESASKDSKEQDDILEDSEDLEQFEIRGKEKDKVFIGSHGMIEIVDPDDDPKEKTSIKNESKKFNDEYRINGKQEDNEMSSTKQAVVVPVATEILASREAREKTELRNMEPAKGNSPKTEDLGFRKAEGALLRKSKKKKLYGEKKHQVRSKKKKKCKCAETDSDDSDSD